MNIDIIKTKETKKEIIYPWIGINKQNGFIVLFHNEGHGIILDTGTITSNYFFIGGYIPTFIMDNFEPFEGSITISN